MSKNKYLCEACRRGFALEPNPYCCPYCGSKVVSLSLNSKNSCITKLTKGKKFSIVETMFDLNGMEPKLGMEIFVTKNGRLSCHAHQDDIVKFIGNVVEDTSLAPYGKYYSIYVVCFC